MGPRADPALPMKLHELHEPREALAFRRIDLDSLATFPPPGFTVIAAFGRVLANEGMNLIAARPQFPADLNGVSIRE